VKAGHFVPDRRIYPRSAYAAWFLQAGLHVDVPEHLLNSLLGRWEACYHDRPIRFVNCTANLSRCVFPFRAAYLMLQGHRPRSLSWRACAEAARSIPVLVVGAGGKRAGQLDVRVSRASGQAPQQNGGKRSRGAVKSVFARPTGTTLTRTKLPPAA